MAAHTPSSTLSQTRYAMLETLLTNSIYAHAVAAPYGFLHWLPPPLVKMSLDVCAITVVQQHRQFVQCRGMLTGGLALSLLLHLLSLLPLYVCIYVYPACLCNKY